MSKMFDGTFKTWDPVYPVKFDVVDAVALSNVLTTISNLPDVPPIMRRILLKAALRIIREVGGCDDDTYNEAEKQIDEIPDDQLTGEMPDLFAGRTVEPEPGE